MPVPTDYISGTITLTNGSSAFSGVGTGWLAADFREGDSIVYIEGGEDFAPPIIQTITTNTSGTLTNPWAGPTLTGVAYRMRYQWDSSRVSAQSRQLIEQLGNGNITSFSSLEGPGVPVFNGPHSLTIKPEQDFINGVFYNEQVDTLADRDVYDEQEEGFAVLVSDIGDGRAALYSKNSNAAGDWSDPAYITSKARVSLVVWDSGNPGSAELVWQNIFDTEITFPADFVGSYAMANSAPTNEARYFIQKNGVTFGTIIFASGSNTASFDSEQTTFFNGDIIKIIAPSPRDSTLSEISITLAGTR